MESLAGLLAALTVTILGYAVAQRLPRSGGHWAGRLERAMSEAEEADAPAPTVFQRLGAIGAGRLPLARLGDDLRWAHLRGKWTRWDEAGLAGLAAVGLVLGVLLGLAFEGGVYPLLFGLVGGYGPFYLVRSAGNEGRKHFRRQFPEMVQALAAEVSAGSSLEQALDRVALSQTVVGEVFSRILRNASGRPLFSSGRVEGAFRQEARAWAPSTGSGRSLPELTSLASQLDMIHQRGTYGPELLSRLAQSVSDEYLAHVNRKAEGLDNALVMPSVVFFFVPFTIVIFVPLAVSLMGAL